jgi:hypothetical protein
MGYLVDILGQNNLHINSEKIPRIGELVQFIPETFDGQEGKLGYRVKDVRYTLGKGFESDVPILILVSENKIITKH